MAGIKRQPVAARAQVDEEYLEQALGQLEAHLRQRLKEKGHGTFASRHETLGTVTEEYTELIEAVTADGLPEVSHELLDIAVACVFGQACINAGTMDW